MWQHIICRLSQGDRLPFFHINRPAVVAPAPAPTDTATATAPATIFAAAVPAAQEFNRPFHGFLRRQLRLLRARSRGRFGGGLLCCLAAPDEPVLLRRLIGRRLLRPGTGTPWPAPENWSVQGGGRGIEARRLR
jgi:hypothetical protein